MVVDIERIHKILTVRDLNRLEQILFYKDEAGVYHLFEQFKVTAHNDYWLVVNYTTEIDHKFSNIRYALCYCINYKRNKLWNIQKLIELDSKLSSLKVDIEIQKKIINNRNDHYNVLAMKLEESLLKFKSVTDQLQSFVDECNAWQSSRFGRCVITNDK